MDNFTIQTIKGDVEVTPIVAVDEKTFLPEITFETVIDGQTFTFDSKYSLDQIGISENAYTKEEFEGHVRIELTKEIEGEFG